MQGKTVVKKPRLRGHALRNENLRKRSLTRSKSAPPLAAKTVEIRVNHLGMTRIELARKSGISRGALRDLELGVHTPTRNTLERFLEFCEARRVDDAVLEDLRDLYTGTADSLRNFIGRLELRAGSSPKLARKVGISPATLWEYRRGNFPVPHALLRSLCKAVEADFEQAEELWTEAERERFIKRGFPVSLAELCVLRLRAGHAESDLLELGLGTAQLRRLCYLELISWKMIAPVTKTLCRDDEELKNIRELWAQDFKLQKEQGLHAFGLKLKKLREKLGITLREVADLCGVGGRKPARIIKHIEEDGHFSQQAFPAGLVALLTDDDRPSSSSLQFSGLSEEEIAAEMSGFLESDTAAELHDSWKNRRIRFHLRHRPEMQLDLRLQREYFGFDVAAAANLLGYTSLEYQKIERGIEPLSDSARSRILAAINVAGHERIRALFVLRDERDLRRLAWQRPDSVGNMLSLLAEREGGIVPLSRVLAKAGLYGISPPRLRSYILGGDTTT